MALPNSRLCYHPALAASVFLGYPGSVSSTLIDSAEKTSYCSIPPLFLASVHTTSSVQSTDLSTPQRL